MNYIGIDIGGTNLKAGLVNDEGSILAMEKRKIAEVSDQKALVEALVALTQSLTERGGLTPEQIRSVGVGVPGSGGDPLRCGAVYLQSAPAECPPPQALPPVFALPPVCGERRQLCGAGGILRRSRQGQQALCHHHAGHRRGSGHPPQRTDLSRR